MATAMEELKAELAGLTERERAELAHFLLNSLDGACEDADVEADWDAELPRRAEEIQTRYGSRQAGRPGVRRPAREICMKPVLFHHDAVGEIDDAMAHYESPRTGFLGSRFWQKSSVASSTLSNILGAGRFTRIQYFASVRSSDFPCSEFTTLFA